jgi:sialidase-1
MKKKSLLFLLALLVLGSTTSWAQLYQATTVSTEKPVAGKQYMIWDSYSIDTINATPLREQNRTWLLYAAAGATTTSAIGYGTSGTDKNAPKITSLKVDAGALFEVGTDEAGNYTFKSVLTGKYITSSTSGAFPLGTTAVGFDIQPAATFAIDGTQKYTDLTNSWTIKDVTGGTDYYWNGDYNRPSEWANPHPFEFWNFEKVPSVVVSYVCKSQTGDDLGTYPVSVEYGAKYAPKAPSISLYKYVSMDCDTDTVTWTANKTINVLYAEDFPVKTTKIADGATDFPTEANWYEMTIAAGKYFLSYTPSETYIPVITTKTAITQPQDSDLWCFTGNPANGFKIYNKAAGTNMILSSATNTNDGNTGANTYPLLTDISTLDATTMNTTWDLTTGYFTGGYYIAQHGIAANRMNYRKPALAYWTGGADAGSTFTFTYVNIHHPNLQNLQKLMATVKAELDKKATNSDQPGYPTASSYTDLQDVYDGIAEAYTETMNETDALSFYNSLNDQYTKFNAAQVSTTPKEYYAYRISNTNSRGTIYNNPASNYVWSTGKTDVKPAAENYNWVFVTADANAKTYYLYNVGKKRFMTPSNDEGTGEFTNSWIFKVKAAPVTLTYMTGKSFNIKTAEKGTYMSISNSYAGPVIDYYADGDAGVPFTFESQGEVNETVKADLEKALHPIGFTEYTLAQGYQTTGVGNKDAVLLMMGISGNADEKTQLTNLCATLKGGCQKDISAIKLYKSKVNHFIDLADTSKVLLGTLTPTDSVVAIKNLSANEIGDETAYLWLTADVKADATIGDKLDARIDSIGYATLTTTKTGEIAFTAGNDPNYDMSIFAKQSFVFSPYENNCTYYRIPAMTVAKDGSLIAASDMRYNSNGDLGSHKIDVAIRRSTDNGLTWDVSKIIAEGDGSTDMAYGYGDPSLITTKSGKIICLMAAGKNAWADGIKNIAMCTSSDNGVTWDAPQDLVEAGLLSDEIGTGGFDLNGRYSTFVSSGRGLLLTSGDNAGRIMFAVDCKVNDKNSVAENYILYSDDEGGSWTLSSAVAYKTANEAKLVQMNDGSLMISVRASGNRGFNTSADGITAWGTQTTNKTLNGNDCNSDIMYYSRETEGASDIMLHTLCNNTSTRMNLKLYASSDKGATWVANKTIQAGLAAYSTMVKCNDGSVGILFEDGSMGSAYTITYVNIPANQVATGINDVNVDNNASTITNKAYYDLSGRRIAKPTAKGLYITQGKKFVIK